MLHCVVCSLLFFPDREAASYALLASAARAEGPFGTEVVILMIFYEGLERLSFWLSTCTCFLSHKTCPFCTGKGRRCSGVGLAVLASQQTCFFLFFFTSKVLFFSSVPRVLVVSQSCHCPIHSIFSLFIRKIERQKEKGSKKIMQIKIQVLEAGRSEAVKREGLLPSHRITFSIIELMPAETIMCPCDVCLCSSQSYVQLSDACGAPQHRNVIRLHLFGLMTMFLGISWVHVQEARLVFQLSASMWETLAIVNSHASPFFNFRTSSQAQLPLSCLPSASLFVLFFASCLLFPLASPRHVSTSSRNTSFLPAAVVSPCPTCRFPHELDYELALPTILRCLRLSPCDSGPPDLPAPYTAPYHRPIFLWQLMSVKARPCPHILLPSRFERAIVLRHRTLDGLSQPCSRFPVALRYFSIACPNPYRVMRPFLMTIAWVLKAASVGKQPCKQGGQRGARKAIITMWGQHQ